MKIISIAAQGSLRKELIQQLAGQRRELTDKIEKSDGGKFVADQPFSCPITIQDSQDLVDMLETIEALEQCQARIDGTTDDLTEKILGPIKKLAEKMEKSAKSESGKKSKKKPTKH